MSGVRKLKAELEVHKRHMKISFTLQLAIGNAVIPADPRAGSTSTSYASRLDDTTQWLQEIIIVSPGHR